VVVDEFRSLKLFDMMAIANLDYSDIESRIDRFRSQSKPQNPQVFNTLQSKM